MYRKPPIILAQLVQQYRYWRGKILRLLDIKGRTAWLYSPDCQTHFAGSLHPESPERTEVIEQALRRSGLWLLLQKIEAPDVSDVQLARVHTRRYLNDLESRVPTHGQVQINDDTFLSRHSVQAARKAAGAAVKAVDMVMRKQAKNAFCAIRPPGHHAHADKASGFCFINNVAVAAMHLIAEYRLSRVAILDFDAHHGDGTQDIFRDDPRVMLLSSFEYPLYPFTEQSQIDTTGKNPHIINTPLKAGDGSQAFRDAIRQTWLPQLAQFQPQFILLSAGFDAHKDDDLSHLNLTDDDFEWLTKKVMLLANRYAKGRIVSLLEGGYALPSLASGAKAHIACLVKASPFF